MNTPLTPPTTAPVLENSGPKAQLNLARKWRSKQFSEIVGQELPVRMLQNSLYIGQIFPVYLFSGQRGCGKTTTARIFAGALNCNNLEAFKKDPKNNKIPCLTCDSCRAMAQGNHPDFIEIDAASHTGVDNVRNIIDAAALLPVMGTKRIYLIDEAHMLSKAAFNAFLKILEEPPASVVFMLATTDPLKIIETVRSRCFQLFFTAIERNALVKHLEQVCLAENIQAEPAALQTIVQETEGSARDALNLLEQVRFAHTHITQSTVHTVLGFIPESLLLDLFNAIATADTHQCIQIITTLDNYNCTPLLLWKKLQELVQAMLALQTGLKPTIYYSDIDRVTQYAQAQTIDTLLYYLQVLYDHEMVLLKSTSQTGIIHLMILSMCRKTNNTDQTHNHSQAQTQNGVPITRTPQSLTGSISQNSSSKTIASTQNNLQGQTPTKITPITANSSAETQSDNNWARFIEKITNAISDPLLHSIFQQGNYRDYNQEAQTLVLVFPKQTEFFSDWLSNTQNIWQPIIEEIFNSKLTCTIIFEANTTDTQQINSHAPQSTKETNPTSDKARAPQAHAPAARPTQNYRTNTPAGTSALAGTTTKSFDVSDKEKWTTAHAALDAFGGKVIEIQEQSKQENHDSTP